MKRRNLLASLAAATSGATVLGTGAFSSVSAQRTVTIETADDEDALLGLDPISNPGIDREPIGRAFEFADGTIGFSIPGTGFGESDRAEGVGTDSVYTFDEVLRISNHGAQAVEVRTEYNGNVLAELGLLLEEDPLFDVPVTLDVGEHIDVGLYLSTRGTKPGEYDETLTIVADRFDE